VFERIETELSIGPLAQTFEFTEIGAVTAWKTVGPFRIDPMVNVEQFDGLWAQIEQSAFSKDSTHEKAVGFGSNSPIPHWIALAASIAEAPHKLSRTLLLKDARPCRARYPRPRASHSGSALTCAYDRR
jgi:hypothetical protein